MGFYGKRLADVAIGFLNAVLEFPNAAIEYSDAVLEFSNVAIEYSEAVLEYSEAAIGLVDVVLVTIVGVNFWFPDRADFPGGMELCMINAVGQ